MELEQSVLFAGLPAEVLTRIGQLARVRNYLGNETIFLEGDPAEDLYVLRDGRVLLTYASPKDPKIALRVTQVQPGESFGWSALTKGQMMSAQARALDDASAYVISGRALHALFQDYPAAGYEVMTRLAGQILDRLRDMRKGLDWSPERPS